MKKSEYKILLPLHLIFLAIGILIYKDYGIGIEENFQRASGFYWLKYLLQFTEYKNLELIADNKFYQVYNLNQNLPKVTENLSYGIVFDLPASLIEILFNFKNNSSNIYLRHFLSFFIFLISCFCFSIFLSKRFSNIYVNLFGTIAYFFSPKIFGASFFDGKDVFFLSMFTITIFFYQNYLIKKKNYNLILFSIFTALLTSSRTLGFMIVVTFLLINFLKILSNLDSKKYLYIILIFTVSYIFFLFIHWPFLWNLTQNLSNSYGEIGHYIFFNGNFYYQKSLPTSYIPKWIFISTPLFITIFFIFGFIYVFKRFFLRLIKIKNNAQKNYKHDFWRGKKEEIDIFIFICVVQTIFIYLTFNKEIYSSWRHFYFFHFFLVYFFSWFLKKIFLYHRNSKKIYVFITLLILVNIEMFYKIYLYHPYQNMYFNNLMSKQDKLNYERDTANISRLNFLKDVLSLTNDSEKKIKIGVASWSPLEDVLIYFEKDKIKNIEITGTTNLQEADFIFTNYYYEVNILYNRKYDIPETHFLLKSVVKDDTLIYSIYKKK